MIGYAPLLGQVRLVPPPYGGLRLGQAGVPLPEQRPLDPDGFMPYNGLFFSQLLKWTSACTGNAPGAVALAKRFEGQYFGNKEVPTYEQGPVRLPDAERTLVAEAKGCISASCTKIGTIQSWMMDEALRVREEQETAASRTILRIPTGRIFAEGSKSEAHEIEIWSCPSAPASTSSGQVSPGGAQTVTPQAAPSSGFPVVPVVGGLAAASLLAYLIFR